MRILILFTFLITNAFANELPGLKNLVVHKIPKIYDNVIFLDGADKEINIQNLDKLKIFPINVGQDNLENSLKFFEDLKIKNLKIYFDSPITLAKKFGLRGIPTSILFNKDGLEFARIIGSIDFNDQKFIDWLANYN